MYHIWDVRALIPGVCSGCGGCGISVWALYHVPLLVTQCTGCTLLLSCHVMGTLPIHVNLHHLNRDKYSTWRKDTLWDWILLLCTPSSMLGRRIEWMLYTFAHSIATNRRTHGYGGRMAWYSFLFCVWLSVTYFSDLYTQSTNSGMYSASDLRIENMIKCGMWCAWNSMFMAQILVYRFVIQDAGLMIF